VYVSVPTQVFLQLSLSSLHATVGFSQDNSILPTGLRNSLMLHTGGCLWLIEIHLHWQAMQRHQNLSKLCSFKTCRPLTTSPMPYPTASRSYMMEQWTRESHYAMWLRQPGFSWAVAHHTIT